MRDPSDEDRTASLMTPAKLAQLQVRPRPAASPAAWLDQMAADAGSGHVRRLIELRQQLEGQLRERDPQSVLSACQALHDALAKLDFSLLQPRGWLARATGKGKEAAGGFLEQHERVGRAAEDLADEVREWQRKQQLQGTATDRTLVEFEVEVRAIEKIMDQGARWLQDMRNQLKSRQAQGADTAAQQQIEQDAARCELLVVRLKQLRIAHGAAQEAAERCKATAGRRSSLLASLQRLLEEAWKSGRQKLDAVAEQAIASGAASDGVDAARRAQQDVQSALQQAVQECEALRVQEQAAADVLAGLQPALQATA
jgi:hypothetical protein